VLTVKEVINWGEVFYGFVPDLTRVLRPADGFTWLLDAVPGQYKDYWVTTIVAEQRDVMISAAATAVGINMTLLLPYSMIRRGWDKNFRGLAIFDLSTGMFIPFVLATSCVVIASATQFHPNAKQERPLLAAADKLPALPAFVNERLMADQLKKELGDEKFGKLSKSEVKAQAKPLSAADMLIAQKLMVGKFLVGQRQLDELPEDELKERLNPLNGGRIDWAKAQAEKRTEKTSAASAEPLTMAEVMVASHLERRNAFDLAKSLKPLTGDVVANYVFGIGVVGMTLSSITLLMLISGFVVCEVLGLPPRGWANRLGTLAAATGVLGPFLWSGEVRFWLAVPTSVFCFTLLPFAYVTFFWMMNSKSLLGDEMPTGGRRVAWNLGTGIAASVATILAVYMVWVKMRDAFIERANGWPYGGYVGLGLVGAVVLLIVFVHFVFPRKGNNNKA